MNPLESVTDITDSSGFKVQHYDYSAFGKILSITDGNGNDVTDAPPVASLFAYTGREYDSESGLYYYRARYYDPNIGRFLQVDPAAGMLKNPSTHINKYMYVGNNPTNFVDPSGSWRLSQAFALGGLIGLTDSGKILKWITENRNKALGIALFVGGAFVTTASFGAAGPLGVAMMGAGVGLYRTRDNASFKDYAKNMGDGALYALALAYAPGGFWGKVAATSAIGLLSSIAYGGDTSTNLKGAEKGAVIGIVGATCGSACAPTQTPTTGTSGSGRTIGGDYPGNGN